MKLNQNRDEGVAGNEYEKDLADIRGLVLASKLSFKEIAEKAGLNPATVSNLASGDTATPHARTIKLILQALDYRHAIVPINSRPGSEVIPEAYWPADMMSRRAERRQKRLTKYSKRKPIRSRRA